MKKRRSLTMETNFRSSVFDSGEKFIEGYFIVFNEFTELFDNFYEKVLPEAIPDDIASHDIKALFDHDTAKVLGRTKSNTLTLKKDAKGLWGRIVVNEDDPEALSIWAKVKRGDVSQASFGFMIRNSDDSDFVETDDGIYTTLSDIDLTEISVVTFPAYESTDISARSADINDFKAKKQKLLNQRKNELKRKLLLSDLKLRKKAFECF